MRRVEAAFLWLLAAAVVVLLLFALVAWAPADPPCPAGQHRVLVPGGHRCDSGVVVRGETP